MDESTLLYLLCSLRCLRLRPPPLAAMDDELLLAPQRALGVLVQAGANAQEIGKVLTNYQLAPDPKESKRWMDSALHASYEARCGRLARWWGATARFDNADKGNKLHVMVCIMTHDREPPPGFPWPEGTLSCNRHPVTPQPLAAPRVRTRDTSWPLAACSHGCTLVRRRRY